AAMWNLMKGKDVMNYGKLQEFVSMLTEAVPGLINHRQRAHLLLGLKARLILELCKGSARHDVDSDVIQTYLEGFPVTSATTDVCKLMILDANCTFIALVQSLLKDPAERAYFFQEVFPVEYGPQYDSALQVLLWELLSKLEMLLPVPDLKQTTAWLSSAPSVLEECMSETAGVAKALETLTKTFSLRKERLGQDALTGQSSQPPHSEELGPGGAAEGGGMNEIPETRQTDAEVVQKVRPDASKINTNLKENWESECETQKSDVSRSTRLQKNTSQSCQEMWNVTTPSRESNEESKMYKNIPTVTLVYQNPR
uniref:Si:zfos-932h1.3 n=1 Tax=Nothobranchius furzeri TaxID=105023 RepID=A0A8C6KVF3_NOTFU